VPLKKWKMWYLYLFVKISKIMLIWIVIARSVLRFYVIRNIVNLILCIVFFKLNRANREDSDEMDSMSIFVIRFSAFFQVFWKKKTHLSWSRVVYNYFVSVKESKWISSLPASFLKFFFTIYLTKTLYYIILKINYLVSF
jgi:hypothetical protein